MEALSNMMFSTGFFPSHGPKSADPGLRQGRGGAWDHRRCGTCPVGPLHVRNWIKPFVAAQFKPFKPSNPSKPFQTLQTFTLKQLPQQAPQGQGHSNDFLWAFKAAVCQPANAPNPSKIPNTFPNRHPRAKATSPTGTPGPRPQQWLSIGFQSCRLPARKRSKHSKPFQTLPNPPNPPKPSKPSKHRPQQAPQGQGHFPNRHPRAKATAIAFYWLSKLPFAKPSKPSKHPPKPSKPSKHPPQQAPQGQGHFPNRHPRAKATA